MYWDTWTFTERLLFSGAFMTAFMLILGIGAWWADRTLERMRRTLPAPRRQAIVRHRLYW